MTSAKGRQLGFLIASALAFVLWISYLIFLTVTARNPIVLSRAQFLVSTLDVIAEVDNLEGRKVKVVEVRWPKGDPHHVQGQDLTVTNLPECDGWKGQGKYILALTSQNSIYNVVSVPRSPGFLGGQRPMIYPLTAETEKQLEEIHKAAK